MKQTKKDNARLKYINQLFYLFSQEEVLFGPLSSAVETLSAHLQPISEAFIQNLKGVCSTASIPKVIAISAVSQQRFAQIHLSEILEEKANMVGTAEDGTFSEAHAGIALERARAALEAELKSEEGTENATNAFIAFLNGVARSEWDDVEGAARELLRQSLVLVWGSFEVLCRDIFVAHLNLNPNDVLRLLAHSDTKRRLQLRGLDFETLALNNFNIADKIGTIIANNQDLSRLVVLKDIFTALFPDSEALRNAFAEKQLWILNQRRHLIVHQRGIVDQQYLDSTGDSVKLGTRLSPLPKEVHECLRLVANIGLVLLNETKTSRKGDEDHGRLSDPLPL